MAGGKGGLDPPPLKEFLNVWFLGLRHVIAGQCCITP
jgi:hypothetical protein